MPAKTPAKVRAEFLSHPGDHELGKMSTFGGLGAKCGWQAGTGAGRNWDFSRSGG